MALRDDSQALQDLQSLRDRQAAMDQMAAMLGTTGGIVSGFYQDFGSVISGDLVITIAVVGETWLSNAYFQIWHQNWPGTDTDGVLRVQLHRMGKFTGDGPDWEPISRQVTVQALPSRPTPFEILQAEVGSGNLLACRVNALGTAANRFWRDSNTFTVTAHFQMQA